MCARRDRFRYSAVGVSGRTAVVRPSTVKFRCCRICNTKCKQFVNNMTPGQHCLHSLQPSLPGHKRTRENLSLITKKQNVSTVALEVHRTISDLTRRKCNIIVTGIRENDNADNNNADESASLKLCEENLSLKPSLSRLGCRRLGRQSSGGRPRKLL